jgi:BA14K-like protein
MLTSMRKTTAIAFFATAVASVASTASATPVADGVAIRNAVPATVEEVWWGWWGPAAGFVAGAIIGGALVAPYYYPHYYYYGYGPGYYGYGYPYGGGYYPPAAAPGPGYASQAGNSCAQRFKSYDPATGTYLGYDGQRHPCP